MAFSNSFPILRQVSYDFSTGILRIFSVSATGFYG